VALWHAKMRHMPTLPTVDIVPIGYTSSNYVNS